MKQHEVRRPADETARRGKPDRALDAGADRQRGASDADVHRPRHRTRPPGRPSVSAPYRDVVAKFLAERPSVTTTELLKLARENGYGGGKSAFFAMVARVRSRGDRR
jgi:hypothetical protein